MNQKFCFSLFLVSIPVFYSLGIILPFINLARSIQETPHMMHKAKPILISSPVKIQRLAEPFILWYEHQHIIFLFLVWNIILQKLMPISSQRKSLELTKYYTNNTTTNIFGEHSAFPICAPSHTKELFTESAHGL